MKLTSHEVMLIRSTFALLEPMSGVAALAFYQRLFTLAPSLRALVQGNNIDAEVDQLMKLLRAATDLADQPHALRATFVRDGTRLFSPGAGQDNRAAVGEALLWTLDTTLGREFTPEARAAWAALVATATASAPDNPPGTRASR